MYTCAPVETKTKHFRLVPPPPYPRFSDRGAAKNLAPETARVSYPLRAKICRFNNF